MKRRGMKRNARQSGFTLMELMTVVAIVGILAASAVVNYSNSQKKAKRVEVIVAISKIKEAQYAYHLEYGDYASSWDDLVFSLDSGRQLSSTVFDGGRYQYTLSQPWGGDSFYVSAVGNIDGDDYLDVWIVEAGRQ